MENQNEQYDLRSAFLKASKKLYDEKEPIYASCPNSGGQCFCTGACQRIIGWIDKMPYSGLHLLKERIDL